MFPYAVAASPVYMEGGNVVSADLTGVGDVVRLVILFVVLSLMVI